MINFLIWSNLLITQITQITQMTHRKSHGFWYKLRLPEILGGDRSDEMQLVHGTWSWTGHRWQDHMGHMGHLDRDLGDWYGPLIYPASHMAGNSEVPWKCWCYHHCRSIERNRWFLSTSIDRDMTGLLKAMNWSIIEYIYIYLFISIIEYNW
jgi:hypothetical protein